jgi:hypothetical protein
MADLPAVQRPGQPGSASQDNRRLSSLSPEIQRLDAIKYLMEGPATLSRISREQIILEAVLEGAARLGYDIPATRHLIQQSRTLSPGLDGLGRGEAVKCLVAHAQNGSMFPASAFAQEEKPGIFQRFIAFMSGKKSGGESNG